MTIHALIKGLRFVLLLACAPGIVLAEEPQAVKQPAIPNAERGYSGNPILQGKGVCDPSVRIFNNKAYLYATHDTPLDAPERKGDLGFHMLGWWVWSSENLVDWKLENTLSPTALGFPEGFNNCWATDALSKNGKYYWYVCTPQKTYVVDSDTPTGPWKAPLGHKPLMAGRDPAPFVDDNGTAYLVTGVWTFNIARLGDDMISLAEKPRAIQIINPRGPYNRDGKNSKQPTDDKAYLHKRGDWYYLSWGCYYAMSKSVYGPYECKGSFLKEEDIDQEIRQKEWDMDRHGSFFEWRGQWYFICNDQTAAGQFYRDSVITYVHYKENGEIAPIQITKKGIRKVERSE